MKPQLLLIVIISLSNLLVAQSPPSRLWATQIHGVNDVKGIEVDKKGASYIYGSFSGTVDFDPSAAFSLLTSSNSGDLFLLKLSREGKFMWAKQFGPAIPNQFCQLIPGALTCSGDSNLYLSGNFKGLIDFNPGLSTYTMFAAPASNGKSFIVNLDTAGKFNWVKLLEGAATVKQMVTGESGNLYLTGKFSMNVDFDPDTSNSVVISPPNQNVSNAFLLKLTREGNFRWVKQLNSTQGGEAFSVACDTTLKRCCFVGFTQTGTDLDPGLGSNVSQTPCGFICELDTGGNTMQTGSLNGLCYLTSIIYNTGFVLSGGYSGSVDADPGTTSHQISSVSNSSDAMILKLSNVLSFSWVKEIESVGQGIIAGGKVVTDKKNHIYYFSSFSGIYDIDPSSAVVSLTNSPGSPQSQPMDYLICEYDNSGALLWGHSVGPCWGNTSPGYVTFNGDIYLSNAFTHTIDVDPGPPTFTLSSNPQTSVFIERLSNCTGTAIPQININAQPSLAICAGEPVVLSVAGAISYQWSHGATQSVIVTTPTASVLYEVMGTDSTGCSGFGTYFSTVNACTGIKEFISSENLVYPNPTTNIISVKTNPGSTINIFDTVGNQVMSQIVETNVSTDIDLTFLKPGVYIVLIKNERKTEAIRVIRQ